MANFPEQVEKRVATERKLVEFNWVLKRVIASHGHTISLLEAALIAASIPDRYDYKTFVAWGETEYVEMIKQELDLDRRY